MQKFSLGLQITERPSPDQTPEWWMSDTYKAITVLSMIYLEFKASVRNVKDILASQYKRRIGE